MQYRTPGGARINEVSAPAQSFLSRFKGSLARLAAMVSTRSPRPRPAFPRPLRGLAGLTAFVLGSALVGFVATEAAGAQTASGQAGLNVDAIESKLDPA